MQAIHTIHAIHILHTTHYKHYNAHFKHYKHFIHYKPLTIYLRFYVYDIYDDTILLGLKMTSYTQVSKE